MCVHELMEDILEVHAWKNEDDDYLLSQLIE